MHQLHPPSKHTVRTSTTNTNAVIGRRQPPEPLERDRNEDDMQGMMCGMSPSAVWQTADVKKGNERDA